MKLSILVTTYNHAPYIEQALQGVVAQTVDFEHEIIVADDCSSDGTREIVQAFAAEHSDRVELILPKSNLGRGGTTIFFQQLEAARGEYLALLDGDDYWIDPRKLKKQVDLLDEHPEFSTCFHDVRVDYEDGSTPSHRFNRDEPQGQLTAGRPSDVSALEDIVRGDYIATCSAVLRSPPTLPDWYFELAFVDWPLHVLSAERGGLAYLDDVMAVYRIHPGGLWSAQTSHFETLEDVQALAEVHDAIDRHLDYRYGPAIGLDVARLYERAAINLARKRQFATARTCAGRAARRVQLWQRGRVWRAYAIWLWASAQLRRRQG